MIKNTLMRTLSAAALLSISSPAFAAGEEISWGTTLPRGLDPHVVYDNPMQEFAINLYDTLYRYENNPPEIAPSLAESYTVTEDGLTWQFKLVEDVTFHDGSPLTADDVVYSFQRLLGIGKGPSGAISGVLKAENIVKIDDLTVQFTLDKPYSPFFSVVPLVAIVNEDLLKANEVDGDFGAGWLSANEAGSGPYKLDAATFEPQTLAILERYDNYFMGWDENPDPIEIIRMNNIQENSTRVLALLRDDIQMTDGYIPPDQIDRIDESDTARIQKDESMRIMVIRMNNTRAPFDNLNFRKCVSHAFQYEAFIDVILKGVVTRNPGPLPGNLWGVPEDVKGYDYDIEKAKEYCDAARAEGAPLDRELEIHIQSAQDQTTQSAQVLQQGMSEVGVNVKLIGANWANLSTETNDPSTSPDMWVHWVSAYFIDPENWIGQMYDSDFHGTWKASSYYKNDEVDQFLRDARTETDLEKRADLYKAAYRQIVADAPDLWIYNSVIMRGMSEKLEGMKFNPVSSGAEVRYMHLAD